MVTIAQRIKEALQVRNMKQSELVEKTKIGKSSISTYISGEYEPKQKNLRKIAQALNVSEAWLMGYDVPMDSKIVPDNVWALGAQQFEDTINAFHYQLKGLGWTCKWISDDQMYLLSNGNLSFKISNEEYGSFVDDLQDFCKNRVNNLWEKSKIYLFVNKKESVPELMAAHNENAEDPEQQRLMSEDIQDMEDNW